MHQLSTQKGINMFKKMLKTTFAEHCFSGVKESVELFTNTTFADNQFYRIHAVVFMGFVLIPGE